MNELMRRLLRAPKSEQRDAAFRRIIRSSPARGALSRPPSRQDGKGQGNSVEPCS